MLKYLGVNCSKINESGCLLFSLFGKFDIFQSKRLGEKFRHKNKIPTLNLAWHQGLLELLPF